MINKIISNSRKQIGDNTTAITKGDRKTDNLIDGMSAQVTEIGAGVQTLLARRE